MYKKMADKYLSDRDGYREDGGLPSKWSGCNLKAMASVHKLQKMGIEKAATTLRFVYDKIWHGRNRSKGVLRNDPNYEEATICQARRREDDSLCHALLSAGMKLWKIEGIGKGVSGGAESGKDTEDHVGAVLQP